MDSSPTYKLLVHRGAERQGTYVWSPFVTKLEFRLRLANLSYDCGSAGPLLGPRGRIPYVELSTPEKPPESLADSTLIIRDLIDRGLMQDLNAGLSKKEAAQGLAIRALLEDKLFFYNIHERWICNYYTMRDYTMARVPFPQRILFGYLAHRAVVRKLHDQGTGRFSDQEIHSFRKEIWESINDLLEDSRRKAGSEECFWIMGGSEPSEADATVFGFVVSCQISPAGPQSRELVRTEFPTVVDYATRIHHRYFPDYRLWD